MKWSRDGKKGLVKLDAIHRGNVQWLCFLSLSFPDDESLKMVSHTKEEEEKILYARNGKPQTFVPGCLLLFFFFTRMREGDQAVWQIQRFAGSCGRMYVCVGKGGAVLVAHTFEVLCQGFYGVGGGTRLDGLWVVCKEEGHLSPDDDDAGFPLRCCKCTEFGVKRGHNNRK